MIIVYVFGLIHRRLMSYIERGNQKSKPVYPL